MDETLSLALSLHGSSPLAFNAFSLFVLLPRLLLRPLPDGCQGSFAAAALSRRCNLLREGGIGALLNEAHEAHMGRVAKPTKAHSKSTSSTSSKMARAAILAGAGAMGRACKVAFSYGLESDPVIAAKFLSKLNLKKKYDHIPEFVAKVKPVGNNIPLKAVTDAFYGVRFRKVYLKPHISLHALKTLIVHQYIINPAHSSNMAIIPYHGYLYNLIWHSTVPYRTVPYAIVS